jgi:hypothetical protein
MWAQLISFKGKLVRKCIYFKIEFCKLGNLKRKQTHIEIVRIYFTRRGGCRTSELQKARLHKLEMGKRQIAEITSLDINPNLT